jgi:hypothetical protein
MPVAERLAEVSLSLAATGKTRLASEVKFPESALLDTMHEVGTDENIRIMKWVATRPTIPPPIVIPVTSWLEDGEFITGKNNVLLALRAQPSLFNELLTAVVARLGDEDWDVRLAVLGVLQAKSSLSNDVLTALGLLLKSEHAEDVAKALLRIYKIFYTTLLNRPSVEQLFQFFL